MPTGVYRHLNYFPDVPEHLLSLKNPFLEHQSRRFNCNKEEIYIKHLKIFDLPDSHRGGIIVLETKLDFAFEEEINEVQIDGTPLTYHHFGYQAENKVEDNWEMDMKELDHQMDNAAECIRLTDEKYVGKAKWYQILQKISFFVQLVASWAKPFMTAFSAFVKLVCTKKIPHIVADYAITAWNALDNFAHLLPFAGNIDDIAAIAEQVKTNGEFTWLRPLKSDVISSSVTKILLWVGVVISVVEAVYIAGNAKVAYNKYNKCVVDSKVLVDDMKERASEAIFVKNKLLLNASDEDSYNYFIGQVEAGATESMPKFGSFVQTNIATIKEIQKTRPESSRCVFARLAIDIVGLVCNCISGNYIAAVVTFIANFIRYVANIAAHYFEHNMLLINGAAEETLDAMKGAKDFPKFVDILCLPDRANALEEYTKTLVKQRNAIISASSVSFKGFLYHARDIFLASLMSAWEFIKNLSSMSWEAILRTLNKCAQYVDIVWENSLAVGTQIYKQARQVVADIIAWLKQSRQ